MTQAEPEGLEAQMVKAVAEVTKEMAQAFDSIWSAPDGHLIMERFLAGTLRFTIERGGIRFEETGQPPEGPPQIGMYL
jgi:hypothetical protein